MDPSCFIFGTNANPGQTSSSNSAAQDLYQQALLLRQATVSMGVPESFLDAVEEQLNQALILNAEFATAYAERSINRYARIFYNIDFSGEQLQKAASDLALANKLGRGNPKILAANAIKVSFMAQDASTALPMCSWLVSGVYWFCNALVHERPLPLGWLSSSQ